MDILPADIKMFLSRDVPADEDAAAKRKRIMATLEEVLEDLKGNLLGKVDERDAYYRGLGYEEPAAVNASGRRIKKPNKDFDGGARPAPGGKRKRKGAANGSQMDIRAAAVQRKYDKKRQELLEKVAKMLRDMSRNKQFVVAASWFQVPVDRKQVPDYYNVIKNPMDLGTIVKRIGQEKYKTSIALLRADIDLVWANCRLYNKDDGASGTIIRKYANDLAQFVAKQWGAMNLDGKWQELQAQQDLELQRLTADDGAESDPESEGTQITPPERQRSKSSKKKPKNNNSADKIQRLEREVADLKKQKTQPSARKADGASRCGATMPARAPACAAGGRRPGSPRPPARARRFSVALRPSADPPVRARATGARREMSYEEKSQLIADLNELPEDKLQNVLNIVEAANKRHGASFDTDDDEVELDIEKLDTQTLWDIKRFLDKYQQQKKRADAQKKKTKQERAARRELAGGDMLEGTGAARRAPLAPLRGAPVVVAGPRP